MYRNEFYCAGCQKTRVYLRDTNSDGTGYGRAHDSTDLFCYDCCAKREKEQMIQDGQITLYHGPKVTVVNWAGTLSFKILRSWTGGHNIAGMRLDADFIGPDGYIWHGTLYGANTQLMHCKRTKKKEPFFGWGCLRKPEITEDYGLVPCKEYEDFSKAA